jgi:hypothetical protein
MTGCTPEIGNRHFVCNLWFASPTLLSLYYYYVQGNLDLCPVLNLGAEDDEPGGGDGQQDGLQDGGDGPLVPGAHHTRRADGEPAKEALRHRCKCSYLQVGYRKGVNTFLYG